MKQTAVEWQHIELSKFLYGKSEFTDAHDILIKAKEMEKEQMCYTKEDVLKAGEMGEINHYDTEHIVSYLDEAKKYNETFNTKEK